MRVIIRHYGALKAFGASTELDLPGCAATAAELRSALAAALARRAPGAEAGIVQRSVLADTERVLADNDVVVSGATLAVLPPVCGG